MNCAIKLAAAIVATTWVVGCGELDDELSDSVEVTSAFTFDECKAKIRNKHAEPGVAAQVGTQLGDFESLGGGSARAHYSISASIYCSCTTGVTKIGQGLIRAKYLALVTPGIVGYPTTDELTTLFGGGRYNFFEHGSIIWKSGTNEAFEVHGQIRGHFQALSNEWGRMGFPTSDEVQVGTTRRRNSFDFGNIYWTSSAGAWAVMTSTGTGQNQLPAMNKPYIVSASMRASTDGGCRPGSRRRCSAPTRGRCGDRDDRTAGRGTAARRGVDTRPGVVGHPTRYPGCGTRVAVRVPS